MAFRKNATYKELFDALEAIVRNTQCTDMLNPTHGQVPMPHLARAARLIEAAKGPVADKRIIEKCIEYEVTMLPRAPVSASPAKALAMFRGEKKARLAELEREGKVRLTPTKGGDAIAVRNPPKGKVFKRRTTLMQKEG
jgi:hypothetical protein